MAENRRPRVVIAGAGFGGLWAARSLNGAACDVTLVDRNNYHTFPALLYQVAAAELQAEDITYPIRTILWKLPGVRFVLAEARRVDTARQVLEIDGAALPYEYLILGTGSIPSSFGIPGVEDHAFFLKTLEQGVALRNHIICRFEAAFGEHDKRLRRELLTFAIVGGGPTGVEYAGALSELVHGPLVKDYPGLDFREVRIVLIEAGSALLPGLPEAVQDYALERLRRMGVEVRLGAAVDRVDADDVHLKTGEIIAARTTIWTAGVRGESLAERSGLSLGRDGRISVLPTLQIPDLPNVYAVGDITRIVEAGKPLPLVAQVAIQSGVTAAENIRRQIRGEEPVAFRYHDFGVMVAIGRNAAGAVIGNRTFTGFFAWVLWLGVHLYKLIGFRNRLLVLVNWAWDYSVHKRAARIVFPSGPMACSPPAQLGRDYRAAGAQEHFSASASKPEVLQ